MVKDFNKKLSLNMNINTNIIHDITIGYTQKSYFKSVFIFRMNSEMIIALHYAKNNMSSGDLVCIRIFTVICQTDEVEMGTEDL